MTLPASLVTSDGTRYLRRVTLPTSETSVKYMVLHDLQLYGHARQEVLDRGKALPEVHQLHPPHYSKLTREWQILWREINPLLTGNQWRKLASCHRAFTNNNSFDCAEPAQHGPFVDFVNMRDIGAALPKIEALVCGGAILRGREAIERGERVLWVETLDGTKPPPSALVVLSQRLYFEAVSVTPAGKVQSFGLSSHPEYVPLISSKPVYIELEKLVKV